MVRNIIIGRCDPRIRCCVELGFAVFLQSIPVLYLLHAVPEVVLFVFLRHSVFQFGLPLLHTVVNSLSILACCVLR